MKFLRLEAAADSELVQRFLREGEVLRRLRHPNLVEVVDFGRAGSTPYILMELLPGGSVKQCFGEAPARLLRRLQPVSGALQVAHDAGVIHRDLKPSNLLFAADGRLKVTDFGVCLWEGGEGTRVTKSQMVVGTLGYMAPEQHGDPRSVDGRCDVYALGAILYEFTTGRSYSQVQMPPAAIRPGFPPRLARILMQSLAPDPAKRIPSMAALATRSGPCGWRAPRPRAGARSRCPGSAARTPNSPPWPGPGRSSPNSRSPPNCAWTPTWTACAPEASAPGGPRPRAWRRPSCPVTRPTSWRSWPAPPKACASRCAAALGAVGTDAALPALLGLLPDPFAQRESAEAASLIAQRAGRPGLVLPALQEPGLGSSWRGAPGPGWGTKAGPGPWPRAGPGCRSR